MIAYLCQLPPLSPTPRMSPNGSSRTIARCTKRKHSREVRRNRYPSLACVNPLYKQKGAASKTPAAPVRLRLENELAAEFQRTRIPGAADRAEVSGPEVAVYVLEFGVIEGVERLKAKLDVSDFFDVERFVE